MLMTCWYVDDMLVQKCFWTLRTSIKTARGREPSPGFWSHAWTVWHFGTIWKLYFRFWYATILCVYRSYSCFMNVFKWPKRSFDVCSRFAVGTGDGVILVYDLRTATKWRVFEALPSMVRAELCSDCYGSTVAWSESWWKCWCFAVEVMIDENTLRCKAQWSSYFLFDVFFPERRFVAGFFRRLLAYLTPHISHTYPSHHTYPTHIHSKRIPPIRIPPIPFPSTRIPPIRIHAMCIHSMHIHSKGVHQQESQTYPTNTYPTNIRIRSTRIPPVRIHSMRIHSKGLHQQEWQWVWVSLHVISCHCYSAGMVMKIKTLLFLQFLCKIINWI